MPFLLRGPPFTCVVLAGLARPAGVPAAPAQPGARPNVLLFAIDDLGPTDLGACGRAFRQTPDLDRFAADGNRFAHFHAAAASARRRARACWPASRRRGCALRTGSAAATTAGPCSRPPASASSRSRKSSKSPSARPSRPRTMTPATSTCGASAWIGSCPKAARAGPSTPGSLRAAGKSRWRTARRRRSEDSTCSPGRSVGRDC
jgi:hypothetical protein